MISAIEEITGDYMAEQDRDPDIQVPLSLLCEILRRLPSTNMDSDEIAEEIAACIAAHIIKEK